LNIGILVESVCFQRLKLIYDEPLPNVAFDGFKLRPYRWEFKPEVLTLWERMADAALEVIYDEEDRVAGAGLAHTTHPTSRSTI